jgi:hypothetical protein
MSVSVIAPKDAGARKIEVQFDGQARATADLFTTGSRQTQQVACEVTGLASGKHASTSSISAPGRWPGMPGSSGNGTIADQRLVLLHGFIVFVFC